MAATTPPAQRSTTPPRTMFSPQPAKEEVTVCVVDGYCASCMRLVLSFNSTKRKVERRMTQERRKDQKKKTPPDTPITTCLLPNNVILFSCFHSVTFS
jgi:PleD family two-component response regulator